MKQRDAFTVMVEKIMPKASNPYEHYWSVKFLRQYHAKVRRLVKRELKREIDHWGDEMKAGHHHACLAILAALDRLAGRKAKP